MIYRKIVFQEPALEELKNDYSFVDMHVHSSYSHDCSTSVKRILSKAERLGIGLAITDHVHAEGSLKAVKNKPNNLMVIPGIEVNTRENKEILLYFYSEKELQEFYNKYVKNNRLPRKKPRTSLTKAMRSIRISLGMEETIDAADQYSCLKSIAHPFTPPTRRSHMFFMREKRKDTLKKIDSVEVMNATMLPRMNTQAMRMAENLKKSFTGGSDAHLLKEVGHVVVGCRAATVEGFLDCIRKKKSLIIGSEIRFAKAMKEFWGTVKTKRHKFDKDDYQEVVGKGPLRT